MTPSGYPDADTDRRGLMSAAAQAFSGLKTFLNAVVMSAGLAVTGAISATTTFRSGIGSAAAVAYGATGDDNTGIWFPAGDTLNVVTGGSLRLQISSAGAALFQGPVSLPTNTLFTIGNGFSTVYESSSGVLTWAGRFSHAGTFSIGSALGAGASDVGMRLGFDTPDGSVHSSAKLASFGTGIGGTYVERGWFKKSGTDGFLLGASVGTLGINSSVGIFLDWNATSIVTVDTNGVSLTGARTLFTGYLTRQNGGTFGIYANGTSGISETVRLVSSRADSALKCVTVGTEQASPNAACVLFQTAKGVSVTSHVDAGNGTAVGLQVMGDGNTKALNTVQLNTDGNARPAADAASRGKLWYSKSAGGAADTLQICLKSAADTYSWVTIATG